MKRTWAVTSLCSGKTPYGRNTVCGNVLLTSASSGCRRSVCATLIAVVLAVFRDVVRVWFRTRAELIAENLFLRRQLALYQERKADGGQHRLRRSLWWS
jgi:hypothetical protein